MRSRHTSVFTYNSKAKCQLLPSYLQTVVQGVLPFLECWGNPSSPRGQSFLQYHVGPDPLRSQEGLWVPACQAVLACKSIRH